ncbi:hypothetical protein PACTADRAFT_61193 [Pachysolen tannophilus NRRL Y-2460]|uniref:TauD/TfdA-like domain-containing protein n=1 Tax=Pachysolen tannophilus NRRL Y-2460 TaxID=669874 RepID=A0A1E4TPQ4_PACTA|nr:hypothetical protein PACTADRAFT_61193 [Pachysolen tannophilus NRRL Y-2460]
MPSVTNKKSNSNNSGFPLGHSRKSSTANTNSNSNNNNNNNNNKPVATSNSSAATNTAFSSASSSSSAHTTPPKPSGKSGGWAEALPEATRKRFAKYNIDLSRGYPERPAHIPRYLEEAYKIRNDRPENYVERGKNADPEKKALFGAAKEVRDLTKHIGTEIVGVQLEDLSEKQLDELALLVAERVVVVFREQDLSPQRQLEIGKYYGRVEVHPIQGHVPGYPGITTVWNKYNRAKYLQQYQKGINSGWHTDLVHEFTPAGITHLHLDSIPEIGGDTCFTSGYAAYDKLSPALQKFVDGKTVIQRSAHTYYKHGDQVFDGPQYIEREHPLVHTHPVTGWKSLNVNRSLSLRIVGLEPAESDLILNYLYDVYEKNLDIQVRISWQQDKPGLGASAIWDNRVSQHVAVADYNDEEAKTKRHANRVTSLGDVLYFDPNSKSQREALGLSLD